MHGFLPLVAEISSFHVRYQVTLYAKWQTPFENCIIYANSAKGSAMELSRRPVRQLSRHMSRRIAAGSVAIARRVGTQVAQVATTTRTAAEATSVVRSRACSP